MKTKTLSILIVSVLLFIEGTSSAQTRGLEYRFGTFNDTIGVFEVWNSEDTSFIVGKTLFQADTLYFLEFQDTVVIRSVVHGVNTALENQKVGIPPDVRKNTIASKFYFLGNTNKPVHFSHFDYRVDNEFTVGYQNKDLADTLHYLDFTPGRYQYFELFSKGKLLSKIRVNLRNAGGKRKGTKHPEEEILDFWLFEYAVYYSDNSTGIDIYNATDGIVRLGNRQYTLIIK